MNRNSFTKLTIALAICAGTAAAQAPVRTNPPVVGFIDASKSYCWARSYTADHMTSHPKQKVSSIAFLYTPTVTVEREANNQWDEYGADPAIYYNVIVKMSGDSKTYLGGGACTAGGPRVLKCFLDGDAGNFTLTQQKDSSVLLENPSSFAVDLVPAVATDEPASDGIMIQANDDHASFLMPKATGGLCDVTWPGVTR
jgi:hypothetical protein